MTAGDPLLLRRSQYMWLTIMVGLLVVLIQLTLHWRSAATRASAEHMALRQVLTDARSLHELQATSMPHPDIEQTPPQHATLLARVQGILAEAGIARNALLELRPEGEVAIGAPDIAGRQWRRQPIRLRLEGLSASEIGSLLHQCTHSLPGWRVERVELAAMDAGPEDRYRIDLTLSLLYLHTPAQRSPSGATP